MVAIQTATEVESGVVLKLFRQGHILTIDPRTPHIPVYICIRQKSAEMFVSCHSKVSKASLLFPTLGETEPLIQRSVNAFLKYSHILSTLSI